MTYIDLVNHIWGPCTDDEADALLWSCTAFPCIDREELEKQLAKVKADSGGDFALAMTQAEDAISEAMKHPVGD